MSIPLKPTGRPADATTNTLGEVLYADQTRKVVPEQEWAGLVVAIAAGDELALHELYDRAHRPAFTLIMRITRNRATAEELTLDVFHDVWRRAAEYDPAVGTVLAWIMNQARSRAIDRYRHDNRRKRVAPADGAGADAEADLATIEEYADPAESARLHEALALLTPGEKLAIETAFFADLTHAETALLLNEPLGTIKTRIRSGLGKLRQALDAGAQPR